jgi:hypothetical protein
MGGMAMLNYDVYEAFRSAGADDEKARKAAEALAQDQGRFAKIEAKLDLHSWMIGAVVALNLAILVRLLVPA